MLASDFDGGWQSDSADMEDQEEEEEPEPLPPLEILNRFCHKIREEALISKRAVERIRSVTVSLLRATAQQSQAQVKKILEGKGIDPNSMPKLQNAFLPSGWEHAAPELNDHGGDYESFLPDISPKGNNIRDKATVEQAEKWEEEDCRISGKVILRLANCVLGGFVGYSKCFKHGYQPKSSYRQQLDV